MTELLRLFNCLSTSISLQKATMPCFSRWNYTAHAHARLHHICPELDGSRADPAQSALLWKHRGSHASLLSNWHTVPRLPRKLQPLHWAHLMTELLRLFNCLPTRITLREAITPCFFQCNYLHSTYVPAPALHCKGQSRLASPECNYAGTKNKEKLCPELDGSRARPAPAPHTASHTTSFRDPVPSDLLWKHRGSHASSLSNSQYSTTWTFAEMLASNFSCNSAIPLWPAFPTKIKLFRVLHEHFLD